MDRTYNATLARLNPYQIAGLAILTSTAASVAVLLAVRAYMSAETASPTEMPMHFSENLTVPGMTFTGEDVLPQDNKQGHSTEGV